MPKFNFAEALISLSGVYVQFYRFVNVSRAVKSKKLDDRQKDRC